MSFPVAQKHFTHDQSNITSHRHHGKVKFYKEDKGYGFFVVDGFCDVYFSAQQIRGVGLSAKPRPGESYDFDVQKSVWNGKEVKYRAQNISKSKESRGTLRESHTLNQRGNNRPHVHLEKKKVLSNVRGEIAVTNQVVRHHNSFPNRIPFGHNAFNVGPPVQVPWGYPSTVSATGPNSAEMAPKPATSDGSSKLVQNIFRKKMLLKSLDVKRLPDRGRRLMDEISQLESDLQKLNIEKAANDSKTEAENESQHSEKDTTSCSSQASLTMYNCVGQKDRILSQPSAVPKEDYGTKFIEFADIPSGPLFGGRMTNDRRLEVRQVTKLAIEEMHQSLKSRPDVSVEETDPKGLKVDLMPHQRQALAWLLWREKQTMSGGVLADDMGLGKTLTMIALVLKQREIEGVSEHNDEPVIEDFKSDDESSDSSSKAASNEKSTEDVPSAEEEDELEKSESTLIVAPASLVFHWEKEIKNRCTKGLLSIHLFHGTNREKDPKKLAEFDVVITTYDIVRRCSVNTTSKRESTLYHINWRRIILDEAHKIKNIKSKCSESVCEMPARSRWAMSGTPVQNDITDMYAILKFLNYRPFSEYKLWKNQVDNKTAQGRERLKTLTSCIVLRREKTDLTVDGQPIVSLPPRKAFDHEIALSKIEREVYEKLKMQSKVKYDQFQEIINRKNRHGKGDKTDEPPPVTATALLVLLLRMRQCCGHLSLLKASFDVGLLENEKKELALEDMFQSMALSDTAASAMDCGLNFEEDKSKYFEPSSVSSKVEFVVNELNRLRIDNPHDKSVVVSQWTGMLNVVALHLDKSRISYEVISGAQTAKKRMDVVDRFNANPGKPMVILLSLQAGGVGLNLIGGNHLFIIDMHWNPALESQACDRIYRVGQKKPVFIHRFIVKDSVEENICKLQSTKLSLAKAVMDGANSKETQKLSLRDMKLLFGL